MTSNNGTFKVRPKTILVFKWWLIILGLFEMVSAILPYWNTGKWEIYRELDSISALPIFIVGITSFIAGLFLIFSRKWAWFTILISQFVTIIGLGSDFIIYLQSSYSFFFEKYFPHHFTYEPFTSSLSGTGITCASLIIVILLLTEMLLVTLHNKLIVK